jgi:hypothetical protein
MPGVRDLQQALADYTAAPTADRLTELYNALAGVNAPIGGGKDPSLFLPELAENPYQKIVGYQWTLPTLQCPVPTSLWCENALIAIGSGNLTMTVLDDSLPLGNPVVEIHRADATAMGAYIFGAENPDGTPVQKALIAIDNPVTFLPMNDQGTVYWNNHSFGISLCGSTGGTYIPYQPNPGSVNIFPQVQENYGNQICIGVLGGFQPWNADDLHRYSKVTDFFPSGAVITYTTANGGTMTAYFVQGSPYISVEYEGNGTRPTFNSTVVLAGISSDSGSSLTSPAIGDTITGTSFVLSYSEALSYKLYASESVTLTIAEIDRYVTPVPEGTIDPNDPNYLPGGPLPYYVPVATPEAGKPGKLVVNAINGEIRFRLAPLADGVETLLDRYKDALPVRGTANITGNGRWAYAYNCIDLVSGQPTASPPLIALTYPDSQANPEGLDGTSPIQAGVTFPSIRGPLTPAVGSYLSFTLPPLASDWFDDSVNLWQGLSSVARQALLKQALADAGFYPIGGLQVMFPTGWASTPGYDAYGAGKRLSAAAQVPLYLDKLSRDASAAGDSASASALSKARDTAVTALKYWMGICLSEGFVYDAQLGMAIEATSLNDPYGSNYQNAAGQDHVFHYGYYIQAAAIAARFDPAWPGTPLSNGGGTYGDVVAALIRDVANPAPNAGDNYFPAWRHTNWLEGHASANSFNAMGGSGRNEESFAEEINCWHGIQMWGKVTGDAGIKNIGATLRARANRAARAWVTLGSPDSQVVYAKFQPAIANDNALCFCNIWSNSAQAQTWFGDGTKSLVDNLIFNIGIEVINTVPRSLSDLVDRTWLETVVVYVKPRLFQAIADFGKGGAFLSIWVPFLSMYDGDFAVTVMDNAEFGLDNGTTPIALLFNIVYNNPSIATLPNFQAPDPEGAWGPLAGLVTRSSIESALALLDGPIPFLSARSYPAAKLGYGLLNNVLIPQLNTWATQPTTVGDALNWMNEVESGTGNYANYFPFTLDRLTGAAILQAWSVVKGWLQSRTDPSTVIPAGQIQAWLPAIRGTVAYIPTMKSRPDDAAGLQLLQGLETYLSDTMLAAFLAGQQPIGIVPFCQWATNLKQNWIGTNNPANLDTILFWNGTIDSLAIPSSLTPCQNILFPPPSS